MKSRSEYFQGQWKLLSPFFAGTMIRELDFSQDDLETQKLGSNLLQTPLLMVLLPWLQFFLNIYIIYIYLYLLYLGTLHGHVFRYSEVCTLHNLDDCVFQECVMLLDRYVASSQDGEKNSQWKWKHESNNVDLSVIKLPILESNNANMWFSGIHP